ncbi:MAG: hypothetical protein L0229_26595 [Blastocatellia bacterium]|nr:hypothetical protein [Blastocatellia bacterium]
MEKINTGRVIAGGLLAGLVMNISESLLNAVVLAKDVEQVMGSLNLPPVGGGEIAKLVALTFFVGIGAVWFYAAIRPRFGSGPKTAALAGLVLWALVYLYSAVVGSTIGFFPAKIYMIGAVWELVATLIATLAGAAVYKEAESRQIGLKEAIQ